ncbi:hypothetical protein FVEG_06968 [Fusarium verticillioides 7600]|uniref:Uncharacterized protein n=1 Tax=Gibberella moniliformis (strain M3125 / FGSC 7600) TaxID=334819 RepID=W7M655_GIBM7|nr:hypothetical protein FVEG_06968 [Fusarium verticillioides 7600]EWG46501.1 hypothetical protein FVEG_06968 [Fusarium verticillioides 7600]
MRCRQPPAATPRVFEANCCCFYLCCAFLPSFIVLRCTALHSRFLRCPVPSLSTLSKPDSMGKERFSKNGRTRRWGLPTEYLHT